MAVVAARRTIGGTLPIVSPRHHFWFHFRRNLSSEPSSLLEDAIVHRRGDDSYGSREYVLLPRGTTQQQLETNPKVKFGSIYAHRNIIFGATVNDDDKRMEEICGRLLDTALADASEIGEQPQAVASLAGLCEWVRDSVLSKENHWLQQQQDEVSFQAIKAIATGVPRPGHSVVGVGTYRDGKDALDRLAREFVLAGLSPESNLYQSREGELVAIEHLADKSDHYLKTAGGAMARFFFL